MTAKHISGTAYYQQIKPRSNLQLYGKPIRRTAAEAKQILADVFERLNVGWDTLDEYRFNILTQDKYDIFRHYRYGVGEFWATYGVIDNGIEVVSFRENIQSEDRDGKLKILIQIHESVMDSDEAIVQILYHEMYEIEELRYLMSSNISFNTYHNLIRSDHAENLHYQAVRESDSLLLKYRLAMQDISP